MQAMLPVRRIALRFYTNKSDTVNSWSRFLFTSALCSMTVQKGDQSWVTFPLWMANPSGPSAQPHMRRETTAIGKPNENRQTLCIQFHNTTAANCDLCQRRYYFAWKVMHNFTCSATDETLLVLQQECCQQWNRSVQKKLSSILIVFLSPHQNLWFSRVCKYWQDKTRDTNRSKTSALCWQN